ncbi:RNA-directed DNA polymerase [Sphingopyxis sp. YF1]|uniref:retron St85 family RNA-directed DNA polymerase n=1 Tax=Sphingopyxis sp. YF1 TaxID=2482763 RepID=UPI001F60CD14|nr:retron St85 family RNA-directed DNA polymerase [Sphingopyxis sp. YF1]UNU42409.1 RNA-directed DNA polymerase [Sphingopyxis sp. YF1]
MLIDWLCAETGLQRERLIAFAASASKRYFVFRIKKRDGSERQIAHPAKPLKGIQRWLNSRVIKSWKVHDAATAYQRGASIRLNALRHAETNFTLRVDFKDFFPSFQAKGIEKFISDQPNGGKKFDKVDLKFITDIITRNGRLTIGSPSSPFITNAMMYSFDEEVSLFCDASGLVYTRYADDIFVSSHNPGNLAQAYDFLCSAANKFPYANLSINHNKTKFLSRKYRRTITGIVITSDRKISIGRPRKKEIKSLINSYIYGKLDDEKEMYLKGMVSFACDADNVFFLSLEKKYGKKVMGRLIG